MLYKPARSPYWSYDFVIGGIRHAKSTKTGDKAMARRIEAEVRREALLPSRARPTISLDEAAGLYAERAEQQSSWRDTKRIIKAMLATIGATRALSEITQRDLQLAVAKRRPGRVNASVNREIEVWRAIWRNADATRFDIGDMPAWGKLMLPVARKAHRTLSQDEEARLFTELRPDLCDFAAFALASGWRLSEVVRLTWRDVDLQARTASTRIKGGDTITRPLSAAMLALVASQPRVCPQVFTFVSQATRSAHTAVDGRKRAARRKGERYPFSADGWRKPWAEALKAAGVEGFRWHDLRHTRGTRILRATGNIAVAAKALGHRSIKTTMLYAQADDQDVRNGLDASDFANDPRTIPNILTGGEKTA